MYDLVLKGGRVVDPSSGFDGVLDVAVENGVIAQVAAGIAARGRRAGDRGRRQARHTGAHRPARARLRGRQPHRRQSGPRRRLLRRHHHRGRRQRGRGDVRRLRATSCRSCDTEVIPFLHICQTGLATNPDIIAEKSVNLDDTVGWPTENKGLIRGIKARMVSPALEIMGMEMPRLAKRAAREAASS